MAPRTVDRFKRVLPLVVTVVFAAAGWFVWSNLTGWLSAPDPKAKVDVLVVPAGSVNERADKAMDLADRWVDEVWFVATGDGPVLDEVDAIRAFASERGHRPDVRIITKRSRTLERDARLIAARLARVERQTHDDLSVAVLAARLEVARTRLVFERLTGDDVLAWPDGARIEDRGWVGLAAEAGRVIGTLAVLGAAIERGSVPLSLPLRALAGGLVIAVIGGAVCRPLARRLGLVATPRLWRAHTTPTPMLGGLAIIVGLGGGVVAAGGVRLGALGAAAAAGVVVVAIVGLIDDIAGLGTRVRLLWAGGAGAVAWLLGLRAQVLPAEVAAADFTNALFTIMWFVGITFAIGIFDNIDGALGGVAAVSATIISVAASLGGQYVVAVAAAALAGSCLGYLVHNINPARMFMGDMGSLGLGFALAALGLALRPAQGPPLSMAVPIIAIGVPIFDMALVIVARVRAGGSPFVGGTDHTSHRLMARGLTVRQAAAFLWGSQLVLGAFAVAIARSSSVPVGSVLTAAVLLGGMIALFVFLRAEPWRPPSQMQASAEVIGAIERAMGALKQIEETVGEEAWRLSNPRAARSTQETLRRLERVHTLLERPDPGAQAAADGELSGG